VPTIEVVHGDAGAGGPLVKTQHQTRFTTAMYVNTAREFATPGEEKSTLRVRKPQARLRLTVS
jgi:hypothetical protein